MMFTVFTCLIATVLVWFLLRWRRFRTQNLPPGPPGYPVIGNLLAIDTIRPHFTFEKWAKQYGDVFFCQSGGVSMVILNSPQLARKAFSSSEFGKVFNDRPSFFYGKYLCDDFCDIVFGKYNDELLKQRKMMHKALSMYGEGKINYEEIVQTELHRVIQTFKDTDGADFNPVPVIDVSLAHAMAMLLCGKRMTAADIQLTWDYLDAINGLLLPTVDMVLWNLPVLRHLPLGPGRQYQHVLDVRDKFNHRFYQNFRNTYDAEVTRGLVDVYIKLHEKEKDWMTERQVEFLVSDTIVGGLISTCRILNGILLALVNNQRCLEKIYQEILDVVGTERPPAYSDRRNMPYTEAAIMESQRLCCQVPLPLMHSCMKDIEFEGYTIPKNSWIEMNLWFMCHSHEIWGDPEVLRPDRFLDNSGNLLPTDHELRQSFFPFGIGRRSCVGEQFAKSRMFLYVATLVQKFKLLPPETGSLPPADPRGFKPGFILETPIFKIQAIKR